MKSVKNIRIAGLALTALSMSVANAATIAGTGSLSNTTGLSTGDASFTFTGLMVTSGAETITFDVVASSGDPDGIHLGGGLITLTGTRSTVTFTVANAVSNIAGSTVTFDDFTSLTATKNTNGAAGGSYNTAAGGSTNFGVTGGGAFDVVTLPGTLTSLTVNERTSFWRASDLGVTFTSTPVPEPSSAALLGLGGLALMLRRKR